MAKEDDKVEGLEVIPDAVQQPFKKDNPWTVACFNRSRIEYRWDEESKSFVIEWPRILSCGPTLEIALKSLQSAVNLKAYCMRTGHIPSPEHWEELNKEAKEPPHAR
jgi:hypothetical protein